MSDRKLVSVFETQDLALLTVAKSLLENVPIRYFTESEVFQDLVGYGRLGANVAAGPIRILVGADQEEAARQVLQGLEPAKSSLRMSRTTRWVLVFVFLVLPILLELVILLRGE